MATVVQPSRSAEIHKQLDHPVVDGDGHWLESVPVFHEYVKATGGQSMLDEYVKTQDATDRWFQTPPEERVRQRIGRPNYWFGPGNTIDRATSMIPRNSCVWRPPCSPRMGNSSLKSRTCVGLWRPWPSIRSITNTCRTGRPGHSTRLPPGRDWPSWSAVSYQCMGARCASRCNRNAAPARRTEPKQNGRRTVATLGRLELQPPRAALAAQHDGTLGIEEARSPCHLSGVHAQWVGSGLRGGRDSNP